MAHDEELDDLGSLVSSTASSVAVSRAIGTARNDGLVCDPLAQHLVGGRYFQRTVDSMIDVAQRSGMLTAGVSPDDVTPPSGRRITDIVCLRTRFIDDEIAGVLEDMPEGDKVGCQVVMLGAGLDSRPWRIPLARGVSWFEVDQLSVVEAKKRRLVDAGAQVHAVRALNEVGESPHTTDNQNVATETLPSPSVSAPYTTRSDENLPEDKSQKPAFELQCSNWTQVAADLTHPSWTASLLASGFDRNLPTLWIAEGLLYYLEWETSLQIVRQCYELCAAEGALLCTYLNSSMMQNWLTVAQEEEAYKVATTFRSYVQDEDPAAILEGSGWELTRTVSLREAAEDYDVELVKSVADCRYEDTHGRSEYYFIEAVRQL